MYGAPIVFFLPWSPGISFVVLISLCMCAPAAWSIEPFRSTVILGRVSLSLEIEAVVGIHLAGSLCSPVRRRNRTAAHLCPRSFAYRATGISALRAAPALGALAVSIWMTFRPVLRHPGALMFIGVAIYGTATVFFGLSRSLPLSLAALMVVGASDMVSVVIRSSMLQLATPASMRGRVSAVNSLFVGASNELGEFESGVTHSGGAAARSGRGRPGSAGHYGPLEACCFPHSEVLTS